MREVDEVRGNVVGNKERGKYMRNKLRREWKQKMKCGEGK